jgi:molecular chaperone DnaJ
LIQEKEHESFERDGNNIIYDLDLSIPDAVLGTDIEVPTLKGKAKVKIDAGTQPGKLLRMKEKGIQGLNQSGTGDQIIRVNVFIPESLTSDEKAWFSKHADSDSFDPKHKEQDGKGFFSRVKDVFQ